jgi:hypothetical protein
VANGDGDSDRTLWIALAGIAATALVGVAGTSVSWVTARDDRAAQRGLARDERTYERRVATYLDAIDFAEGRIAVLQDILETPVDPGTREEDAYGDDGLRASDPDLVYYEPTPPPRLASRLRAFGSREVLNAFQEVLKLSETMLDNGPDPGDGAYWIGNRQYISRSESWVLKTSGSATAVTAELLPRPRFQTKGAALRASVRRFEKIVHDEVG